MIALPAVELVEAIGYGKCYSQFFGSNQDQEAKNSNYKPSQQSMNAIPAAELAEAIGKCK
ncbi:hypothetical protein [Cyclobacterium marinum]|uniref:hypothetical protein n=1 Tax=Cyclobacterium marinum TaxID=104 RepID=UPI0002D5857E|nr:hypothetical protein [Cyclobacterium marinum]MBI0397718.1 hypothetical protein [Cyclobacterium marinum]MBR9777756.1 hypothetical protein [Cytophagales bacterium]|tara:strand:+ start:84283 stop:84462 length:180 start_codon:yes stop_codon:yes gene_type:complete